MSLRLIGLELVPYPNSRALMRECKAALIAIRISQEWQRDLPLEPCDGAAGVNQRFLQRVHGSLMVARHAESKTVNAPALQIVEADKSIRISCLG
jgi:hypothetical protein